MRKLGIFLACLLSVVVVFQVIPVSRETTPAYAFRTLYNYVRVWPYDEGSYTILDSSGAPTQTTFKCYHKSRTIVNARVKVYCFKSDSLQGISVTAGMKGQAAKTSSIIHYNLAETALIQCYEWDFSAAELDSIKVVRSIDIDQGYVLVQGFYKK